MAWFAIPFGGASTHACRSLMCAGFILFLERSITFCLYLIFKG